MENGQKLFITYGANVFRKPVMALHQFVLNRRLLIEITPTCAFSFNKLIPKALQQEFSKCVLASFLRFDSIGDGAQVMRAFFVLARYALANVCPGLVIVFLCFCHVVSLLLVDGVATTTLAGFGVAFYLWRLL